MKTLYTIPTVELTPLVSEGVIALSDYAGGSNDNTIDIRTDITIDETEGFATRAQSLDNYWTED